jgi:hypothetical protein
MNTIIAFTKYSDPVNITKRYTVIMLIGLGPVMLLFGCLSYWQLSTFMLKIDNFFTRCGGLGGHGGAFATSCY